MKEKALGILICMLFIGAAIIPVEGTMKDLINEKSKVTSSKTF